MCPSHPYTVAAVAATYYYREKILCMVWLHYLSSKNPGPLAYTGNGRRNIWGKKEF